VAVDPVAFACTTQQNALSAKIKEDIRTILGSGTRVTQIHYFCVASVATSERHALQEWSRQSYSVELEIHDGRALAENLAQTDVFWIAMQYLGVPSEIYPRPPVGSADSYEQARAEWQVAEIDTRSYAQFHSIKRLLRHVTWEDALKPDLPFWIGLIKRFLDSDGVFALARKATYEAAVATLRGLGSLVGQENELRGYFREIPATYEIDELEDYTLLLSYCTTATVIGHAHFSPNELQLWRHSITDRLDEAIDTRDFPSTRATLLQLRGAAAQHVVESGEITFQVDAAIEWWAQIPELLPEAPLFPLERFADLLTVACESIDDNPHFDELTARVDESLSQRFGGFAAAQKCKERAIAYHGRGRILDAIREAHKAKSSWFAQETLGDFIFALLTIGRWYSELGLCLAAKYYALAAASIAISSTNPNVKARAWLAFRDASDCDYLLGAWAGFLNLTDFALRSHHRFSPDSGNLDLHEDLVPLIFHSVNVVVISQRIAPAFSALSQACVKAWNLGELYDECYSAAVRQFEKLSDAELNASLEEQLSELPVSDIHVNRSVFWSALGVEWTVEWVNDYRTAMFGEQFVASIQILQAEMARKDLCLPDTRVRIAFLLAGVIQPKVEPIPCNEEIRWKVLWPIATSNVDLRDTFLTVLTTCVTILRGVSFLPHARLMEIVEELFREGVPSKTLVAQPYTEVFGNAISQEAFNDARKVLAVPLSPTTSTAKKPHAEMAAHSGPGPGYSQAESYNHIARRYERIAYHLPITLMRLRASEEFKDTVRKLRLKGWQDWHILGAVFSSVLNFRAHSLHTPHLTPLQLDEFREEFLSAPESEGAMIVPATEFTEEKLEFYRNLNIATIMKTWGLDLNHPTVSPQIMERFLGARYGYWTDDVHHADLFGVQ